MNKRYMFSMKSAIHPSSFFFLSAECGTRLTVQVSYRCFNLATKALYETLTNISLHTESSNLGTLSHNQYYHHQIKQLSNLGFSNSTFPNSSSYPPFRDLFYNLLRTLFFFLSFLWCRIFGCILFCVCYCI